MIVMDYHAILLQLGITPNYKGYHRSCQDFFAL